MDSRSRARRYHEDAETWDLRSDDGADCFNTCQQYSWETSLFAPMNVSEISSLLGSQLRIKQPHREERWPPQRDERIHEVVVGAHDGDTLDQSINQLWTDHFRSNLDQTDEGTVYHLVPRDPDAEVDTLPMFLLAVCLILRLHAMGLCVCVCLDPRWMGVPGTQFGLRSQLRALMANCTQVSAQDICRMYNETLVKLLFHP